MKHAYIRLIPLILLALVVASSGCIGGGGEKTTAGSQGLVITNFAFDASTIPAGDETTLVLELENVGGAVASGVAQIYGVPFSGDYAWNCGDTQKSIPELRPPDPIAGTPGDTYTVEWTCITPNVPTQITQQVEVDVIYSYQTKVTGTLMVVDKNYLKSLPANERQSFYSSGGITQLSVSSGPLAVTIVAPRPLIYQTQGESLRVRVIVRNVGGGKVEGNTITIAEQKGITCETTSFELTRGEEKSLICNINVQGVQQKAEVPFSLIFSYTYVNHATATVTLQPEEF